MWAPASSLREKFAPALMGALEFLSPLLLSPRTLLELFRSPRDDRPVQLLEPGRGSPIAVPLTLFAIIEAKKRGPVLYF